MVWALIGKSVLLASSSKPVIKLFERGLTEFGVRSFSTHSISRYLIEEGILEVMD